MTWRALGLMSGTSADGLDLAVIEVDSLDAPVTLRVLAEGTAPYPPDLRQALLALQATPDLEPVLHAHGGLPHWWAREIDAFLSRHGIPADRLHVVGSHGQTVRHRPEARWRGGSAGFSLQIGDGSILAQALGVPVVCDFRMADIGLGGQGAPLVPFVDALLFRDSAEDRVLLNIGGIANVTLLPRNLDLPVYGFDTGPGNMVIDAVVSRLSDGALHMDEGGSWAAQGMVHEGILADLLRHDAILRPPPKSTGREEFGPSWVDAFLLEAHGAGLSSDAIVATVTELTARSIVLNLVNFSPEGFSPARMLVGGGGAHNRTLMAALARLMAPAEVAPIESLGVPVSSDAREAVAFAVLALHTLLRKPANLPLVTGASRPAILGKVCYPA